MEIKGDNKEYDISKLDFEDLNELITNLEYLSKFVIIYIDGALF